MFIKDVCVKMLNCLGNAGKNVSTVVNNIPLSRNTVTRRIQDISNYSKNLLINKIQNCSFYSLALDETTDNTDVAQLLIFIRLVDNQFNVEEELLSLMSLHNTTKGVDVYRAMEIAVEPIGGFSKLSAVCTDGAPSMRGGKEGLRGQFNKKNEEVPFYHCIIHQEALCAKAIGLKETMTTVVSVVNKIRGGHHSLTHRKFKFFLEELNAAYGDLTMYTEVRWLSRGNCLSRFFSLRNEVLRFLEEHVPNTEDLQEKMKDKSFSIELAFLTDITYLINVLNSKLQTRKQHIFDLISLIDGFLKKLGVLKQELSEDHLFNFSSCSIIKSQDNRASFKTFTAQLERLESEFLSRFQDFQKVKKLFPVFFNPMSCDINEQIQELKLELCDLQSDVRLILCDKKEMEFWKLVPQEKYPELTKAMLKLTSMFGSTHVCECTFSYMKFTKTDYRNRLSDANLENLLRISTTSQHIDFDNLVKENVSDSHSNSV